MKKCRWYWAMLLPALLLGAACKKPEAPKELSPASREETGAEDLEQRPTASIALHGKPKYPAGFRHFDYVNPDAPKGGTLRLHSIGSFDSFHNFAQRGVWPAGISGLYDTLITSSEDEINVYYGLIADKLEYPSDYTWIIYDINPAARFQDGKPIRAQDVVFSFYTFNDHGVPQFKQHYQNVDKVEALDARRVKFSLKQADKEMLISLGGLTILPEHYWTDKDFTEPMTEVPLGSGPYTISDYKMGQYVVYERLKDYWGRDLPVVKGQLNFDYIRYDYYRDETVAFEAFKAGEYDFHQENIAKNWATLYTGPAFDAGYIKKELIPHEIPGGMQCFVFNIQRPQFADRRVRMALNQVFDFEWMNRNLFYNQYTRNRSYFQNTDYEAFGLPSKEELKLLEPLRGQIPDEVFTTEYQPPVTDGSGNIRPQTRAALALLKEAGWEIRDRRLTNVKNGEVFTFELLLYSPSWERVGIAMKKNMEKIGIDMKIRVVDTTQYTNRLRERDFDMVLSTYGPYFYPSSNLEIEFHSDFLDYTWNTAGVQDPAVDALVEGILANQENEEALIAYGRALDRVLVWNHYVIPQWHLSAFRVASWDKFSRPDVRPKYGLGLNTWWIDPAKERKLPQ